MIKARWDKLRGAFGIKGDDKICEQIVNAYSEKHRAYHTLKHLESMLKIFDDNVLIIISIITMS